MDVGLLPKVTELLPHRPPFLFVDRIVDANPPERLTAEVTMRPDHDFYRGHFPGEPITPGVIILEAMTQTTVLLSILSSDPDDRFKYLFVGADRFKVKAAVSPNTLVTLTAQDIVHKGSVVRGTAAAFVEDKVVSSAELSFMRYPRSANG